MSLHGRIVGRRAVRAGRHAGWLGLLAACLVACDSNRPPQPPPPPAPPPLPASLEGAPVYNSLRDPAPADASEISLADFERLAADREIIWFTAESEAQAGAAREARRAARQAEAAAALAAHPEFGFLLEDPIELEPGSRRNADGTIEIQLPDGSSVLLDSEETDADTLALWARMGSSRDNALGLYQVYWEALADDLREDLPTPEEAGQLDLEALREATDLAADRVIESVPNESPPEPGVEAGQGKLAAWFGRDARLAESTQLPPDCGNPPPYSPAVDFNYTLKAHATPIRDQGKRGSCTGFALAAGIETKASRLYSRKPDLSEQHLWSTYKFDWDRHSGDVGDGGFLDDLLVETRNTQYYFRSEGLWTYNTSWDRIEISTGYSKSCDNYTEFCSNTNHQLAKLCTTYGSSRFCFWSRPGLTVGSTAEQYRLLSASHLGPLGGAQFGDAFRVAANVTLKNVNAMLAGGNPVLLSTSWRACMKGLRTIPGVPRGTQSVLTTENCYTTSNEGNHAVMIVGFIPYLDLITRYAGTPAASNLELDGSPFTDGVYIVKNSHGCGWGDRGYGYFSSELLRRYGRNAYSVNTVVVSNIPTVTLSTSRSRIDQPGQTAVLTANVPATITRVEFYKINRNNPNTSSLAATDDTAPFTWQAEIPPTYANLGAHRFFAIAYDAGGNSATSQVINVQLQGGALAPPQISVTASAAVVSIPGSVDVTASLPAATGTSGRAPIALVEFLKSGTVVAEVPFSPASTTSIQSTRPVAFGPADNGIVVLSVRATDVLGKRTTASIPVTGTTQQAPSITSFTATPSTASGSPVTLAWTASNFTSLSLSPGGPVAGQSSLVVNPAVTTEYVLTAANSLGSATASVTVTVPPPVIASFTATPSSLPVGGGAVTLSWQVLGATSVNISGGIGAVTGSGTRIVNPVVSTSWTLSATGPSGSSTANASVQVDPDTVPPTVSLVTSSAAVTPPGSITLTATASDNVGVVAVDFYRGQMRFATDTNPADGFGQVVNLTVADLGIIEFTAVARDAAGNSATSAPVVVTVGQPPPQIASFTATPADLPQGGGSVTLSWNVTSASSVSINNGVGTVPSSGSTVVAVTASTTWTLSASNPGGGASATASVSVAGDDEPPTVSLAASSSSVFAPATVTLTATTSDNVGVVAVDFFRGATRIGGDTTPGDGFTQAVDLTAADVGEVSFTAVARDAAGNAATSAAVVVTVAVAASGDRWVAPAGSDSNAGTPQQPYQSVGRALANIGPGGTVWLQPGIYPWANEINRNGTSQLDMKTLRVPAGARLRAITAGTVQLNFGVVALGSVIVSDVHFTLLADDVTEMQPSIVSIGASGELQLRKVTFGRVLNLQASAGGNITFDAQGDADHEWFTAEFQGAFGRVDVGHTRVLGGRMTLTRIPDGSNALSRRWGTYGGVGRLGFEGVVMELPEVPSGISQHLFLPIQGGTLEFIGSEVRQLGSRLGHILAYVDHTSLVRLTDSTVTGPFWQVISMTAGGNVELRGTTLSGGATGIGFAGGQEPGGLPLPQVEITDGSTLRDFSAYAVHLPNHGRVTITDSVIRDNELGGVYLQGTENLPWVTGIYRLNVRNSIIADNGGRADDSGLGGLILRGSPNSIFDLGTDLEPGGNTLLGRSSGQPAVRVGTTTEGAVLAVGNRWIPNVQGADEDGRYLGDVLVSAGEQGANFVITSGALLLAVPRDRGQ